jgi:hypothetical protein
MIVLVYKPTDFRPDVRVFHEPPSQEVLEQLVGGEIEALPGFDTIEYNRAFYQCIAVCDCNAVPRSAPVNAWATSLWHIALRRKGQDGLRKQDGTIADWLSGNVAVVYHEHAAYARLANVINQPPESPNAYIRIKGVAVKHIVHNSASTWPDRIAPPSFSQLAQMTGSKTAALLEDAIRDVLK